MGKCFSPIFSEIHPPLPSSCYLHAIYLVSYNSGTGQQGRRRIGGGNCLAANASANAKGNDSADSKTSSVIWGLRRYFQGPFRLSHKTSLVEICS